MLLAGKLVSRNSDLHLEPFYGGGKAELFSLTKPNVGRPLINAQVSREFPGFHKVAVATVWSLMCCFRNHQGCSPCSHPDEWTLAGPAKGSTPGKKTSDFLWNLEDTKGIPSHFLQY